jgi:hypothetical protein
MIAHVSVPSTDPKATSLLLASIMDGEAFPFPVVPGAWIAVARDGSGLAVEVYPDGMAHHPGKGEVDPAMKPEGPQTMPWEDQIFPDGLQIRPATFHFAITTALTDKQVLQLARNAGLRAIYCDRGGVFGVVEVWLDNTILIEVLSHREVERYKRFMNTEGVSAMFGPGLRPAQLTDRR